MRFANLADHPDKIQSYVKLIEKSFSYSAPYSFLVDFYPLVNSGNYRNCFMLLDEDENIIATCAAQKRDVVVKSHFPIYFMGGISVKENLRGKGVGGQMVRNALSCLEDHAWVGLWSEKKTFFNNLDFHDFGEQYFLPKNYLSPLGDKVSTKIIPINKLNDQQWNYWKATYAHLTQSFITVIRTEKDWSNIAQISSAYYVELCIENKLIGYAVVHKGMDLQNVVHEFYSEKKFEELALSKLNKDFSIWLPIFDYNWDKFYLGSNVLIKSGKTELWKQWQLETYDTNPKQQKHFFISGLDSV